MLSAVAAVKLPLGKKRSGSFGYTPERKELLDWMHVKLEPKLADFGLSLEGAFPGINTYSLEELRKLKRNPSQWMQEAAQGFFDDMDRDKDGFVNVTEFKHEHQQALVLLADSDGDDRMDGGEFKAFAAAQAFEVEQMKGGSFILRTDGVNCNPSTMPAQVSTALDAIDQNVSAAVASAKQLLGPARMLLSSSSGGGEENLSALEKNVVAVVSKVLTTWEQVEPMVRTAQPVLVGSLNLAGQQQIAIRLGNLIANASEDIATAKRNLQTHVWSHSAAHTPASPNNMQGLADTSQMNVLLRTIMGMDTLCIMRAYATAVLGVLKGIADAVLPRPVSPFKKRMLCTLSGVEERMRGSVSNFLQIESQVSSLLSTLVRDLQDGFPNYDRFFQEDARPDSTCTGALEELGLRGGQTTVGQGPANGTTD
eukprot:TRINITY_DN12136_c0_g3_i1.p1 TRINITY_DN12136_c0_g3~~TRINITY_DN12136_c0_g3_i1.p1  ORF type:complete len:441 (+),score=86.75 TRINITY_DN12136_c0_g3_i1:53-1324(+)